MRKKTCSTCSTRRLQNQLDKEEGKYQGLTQGFSRRAHVFEIRWAIYLHLHPIRTFYCEIVGTFEIIATHFNLIGFGLLRSDPTSLFWLGIGELEEANVGWRSSSFLMQTQNFIPFSIEVVLAVSLIT